MESRHASSGRRSEGARSSVRKAAVLSLLAAAPLASANCISLSGSKQCGAFSKAKVSTTVLPGQYPFLAFITNVDDFDSQLSQFVQQDYVRDKFVNLLGCQNVTLGNTTSYYARYTTSVICNAIVQNSIQDCQLSSDDSQPLCAESCAQQATSEYDITMTNGLCEQPKQSFMDQIRADFTQCSLPSNSLSGSCIVAEANEPDECGFASNLQGLCRYCGASSPNSTDSCCNAANVNTRCTNVHLPSISPMPPLMPSSTASASNNNSSGSKSGLSGGAIAGIVIGSIIGALLLGALIFFLFTRWRRNRGSQQGSIFNTPTPKRSMTRGSESGKNSRRGDEAGIANGRVARMTALEAARAGNGAEKNAFAGFSDSDNYHSSTSGPQPLQRTGSLSSPSALGMGDESSPSGGLLQESSPGDMQSGQSEQLPFFKDYYSQDEIHPNDKVATLWAYQPRAADEFQLERGDMLRVVGIWDDGWATGVRLDERAEDYEGKEAANRDSGVSNGSREEGGGGSPPAGGDVKAFPLVCVCLPQHWRKTVESDSSTDTTSPSNPGNANLFSNF